MRGEKEQDILAAELEMDEVLQEMLLLEELVQELLELLEYDRKHSQLLVTSLS